LAHEPAPDRLQGVRERRLDVDDSRGEDDVGRRDADPVAGRREESIGLALQGGHGPHVHVAVVLPKLRAHAFEQFDAVDAVGEARMVMRPRDPGRAAFAGIDQDETAVETREIDRGRQAAGPAPDDNTIDGRIARPRRGDPFRHMAGL
jgi:hypothetical protein